MKKVVIVLLSILTVFGVVDAKPAKRNLLVATPVAKRSVRVAKAKKPKAKKAVKKKKTAKKIKGLTPAENKKLIKLQTAVNGCLTESASKEHAKLLSKRAVAMSKVKKAKKSKSKKPAKKAGSSKKKSNKKATISKKRKASKRK